MKNILTFLLISGLLLASTLAFPNIPGFSAINNDERDMLDGLDDDDPVPPRPNRPKFERKNAIDFSKIDLDELLGEDTVKENNEEKNILDGMTAEVKATLQAFIGSVKQSLEQGRSSDEFDDGMINIEKAKNSFVPHDDNEERMEDSGKKNFDEVFEKVLAGLEMDQMKENRQKDYDFDPFEPEL